MIPLVLAVDVQGVFAVIVVVVSILSWIMNLIQGNNANAPRQQKPPGKPQTSRSELEQLIKDLTNDKRRPEPRKEAPPPPRPQPPETRPRPERVRSGPSANPQRPGSPPPYSPSRQTQQQEPKRPPQNRVAAKLGEGIRSQHVGSRVESKVPQEVKADLLPAKDVQLTGTIPVVEKTVHPMVKFLRDPAGVRQAIILNEILQRPKSLRR